MGNGWFTRQVGLLLLILLTGCASADGLGAWTSAGGGTTRMARVGPDDPGRPAERGEPVRLSAEERPVSGGLEGAVALAADSVRQDAEALRPEDQPAGPNAQAAPLPAAMPADPQPPEAMQQADASSPQTRETKERAMVALTFDDGPDGKYTPKVLDILKEHGVKATFFLVGTQVSKYPETAKRIREEGHDIGNHSWSHQDLAKLKLKELDEQIARTQEAIEKATGFRPDLVRAPNGSLSDDLISYLHDQKLTHVYWTVDPRDWAGTSVAAMRENIRKHTRPGGIILLHSFGGRKNALDHTLELLPLIIDDLRKAGYEFGTVDEMIAAQKASASAIR
jgi:peptidoglycan/xylan/chitin deacetylase (PgdA/CDA1 family)